MQVMRDNKPLVSNTTPLIDDPEHRHSEHVVFFWHDVHDPIVEDGADEVQHDEEEAEARKVSG